MENVVRSIIQLTSVREFFYGILIGYAEVAWLELCGDMSMFTKIILPLYN